MNPTDQELQKIADNLNLRLMQRDGYPMDKILTALKQVRDSQEEKLKHIKEELEVALGKCHGSLSYPVGTILKQLISKIGDTQ